MTASQDNKANSHPFPALPRRVLVVDDDEGMGLLIRTALQGSTEVSQVFLGSQTTGAALAFKPDLILLDLHMPNINGYEVLRQIKQHPTVAGIPVICMTADRDDVSHARVSQLGAIGSLLKPLHVATLPADIASMLSSASNVLESPSKLRRVIIAFNAIEKKRLIKLEILRQMAWGDKVILLSLSSGDEVCDFDLNQLVMSEALIFLQIQASLVAKFPYLLDLAPVMADLRSFLGEETKSYRLLFDDAHLVIHAEDGEAAIARAHSLKDALIDEYENITLFFSRDGGEPRILNKLAEVFVK